MYGDGWEPHAVLVLRYVSMSWSCTLLACFSKSGLRRMSRTIMGLCPKIAIIRWTEGGGYYGSSWLLEADGLQNDSVVSSTTLKWRSCVRYLVWRPRRADSRDKLCAREAKQAKSVQCLERGLWAMFVWVCPFLRVGRGLRCGGLFNMFWY